ncbi:putative cyclase [Armillaria mellea]|nr:putative cyclase [Armillaria mellea]
MTVQIIDLSHPLDPSNMSFYPGDPPYTCSPHATVPEHGYSVQALSLCTHTGTLVDAPSHFFAQSKSIDQIPLASFIRPAIVVDVSQNIRSHLFLIRTDWCKHWGKPEYVNHPFLDADAATPARCSWGAQTDFGVHQAILGAGGLILYLTGAFVNFVPLNLKGGDGSPVRAFAYVP